MNTAEFPVESISWHDAQDFCKKVASLPEVDGRGLTCRLPTEAEWEYACRAGTKTLYWFGETISKAQANYAGEYGRTTKVGSYPANAWGLDDMHGNVWQWCQDWYAKDYYANSPRQDPPGPQNGAYRVLRGGSFYNDPGNCRSASRSLFTPDNRGSSLGFRVMVVSSVPGLP
jgi:formylglycine-generating enzyme required for sulfatase activity